MHALGQRVVQAGEAAAHVARALRMAHSERVQSAVQVLPLRRRGGVERVLHAGRHGNLSYREVARDQVARAGFQREAVKFKIIFYDANIVFRSTFFSRSFFSESNFSRSICASLKFF